MKNSQQYFKTLIGIAVFCLILFIVSVEEKPVRALLPIAGVGVLVYVCYAVLMVTLRRK